MRRKRTDNRISISINAMRDLELLHKIVGFRGCTISGLGNEIIHQWLADNYEKELRMYQKPE